MSIKPKRLVVSKLFISDRYEIPIYQRNYAWEEKQIHQLIDDIYTAEGTYFLGNLIVNHKEDNVYEVIDGQQRLTTLYLLQKYLNMNILKASLYFEARVKSNSTLQYIGTENKNDISEQLQSESEELIKGYNIIKNCFNSNKNIEPKYDIKFREKLNMVQLIRIQVPEKIDLNHYFEIMNTRGEQLEFHEIAKAKLLSKLSADEDKRAGAFIWEACSKMDTYVQMNFNAKVRGKMFSENWTELNSKIKDFDSIKEKLLESKNDHLNNGGRTLIEVLKNSDKYIKADKQVTDEENERFESVISFPNFILQVNAAISENKENESILDDKNFLKNIEFNWTSEESSKKFLYNLLKCRVLFDRYILKREFAKDYKENGKWSLQRIECYKDNKKSSLKPKYVAALNNEDDINNKKLRTIESCLRVTYTSPKTMYWISLVIRNLLKDENCDLIDLLEKYCEDKVNKSDYKNASGFGFQRIVFTYLDYLLYRDGYSYNKIKIISPLEHDWQFQFRNSIEHFYPQNPIHLEGFKKWDNENLNSFGNLALITASGNSQFSNLPPEGKVKSHPNIINQSLKLRIMKEMIDIEKTWNEDISNKHKEEMFNILNKNIKIQD